MMNIRGLKTVALFLAVLAAPQMIVAAEPSLAEKLGYKATDKLLIVNGDDVGMSHSANMATINSMEKGVMTSGTIMVPCPWFPEIAKYAKTHPKSDFGIHLTHTSEWNLYRWGPVASKHLVPGLIDPDGYLWGDESRCPKCLQCALSGYAIRGGIFTKSSRHGSLPCSYVLLKRR